MVRFTLFYRESDSNMRMEFHGDDKVSDVDQAAREALGMEAIMLRNGYNMLALDSTVADGISDGDVVEVIPDPEAFFSFDARLS